MADTAALSFPLDVAFHGMDPSDHISHQLHKQLTKLERFSDHIVNVRAVAEARHKSRTKAQIAVKLEISVPGNLIVAEREGRPHESVLNADVYGVIDAAVDVAARQLDRYISKHVHPEKPRASERKRATITHLDRERRTGQLETEAGETLDFAADAVPDEGFDTLAVGTVVTFERVRIGDTRARHVVPAGEAG